MKKSHANPTTTKNLEEKFDRGENVLDYFDVRKARVVDPQVKRSVAKGKSGYLVQRNSNRRPAVVREKSACLRKKKVESAALVTQLARRGGSLSCHAVAL